MATDDVKKIFISVQDLELVDYFKQATHYIMVFENSQSPWVTMMPIIMCSVVFCFMVSQRRKLSNVFFSVAKEVAWLSQRGRGRMCVLVIQYVVEGNN
jgi:hypothetical protein